MGISKIGTSRYKGFICTHHKYEQLDSYDYNQLANLYRKKNQTNFVFTKTFVLEKWLFKLILHSRILCEYNSFLKIIAF